MGSDITRVDCISNLKIVISNNKIILQRMGVFNKKIDVKTSIYTLSCLCTDEYSDI